MDILKEKAAGLATRAAFDAAKLRLHRTRLRPEIKTAIAASALWGLVPVRLADWIIRRGGLSDA